MPSNFQHAKLAFFYEFANGLPGDSTDPRGFRFGDPIARNNNRLTL